MNGYFNRLRIQAATNNDIQAGNPNQQSVIIASILSSIGYICLLLQTPKTDYND